MVIDTSAVVAILLDESESEIFSQILADEAALALSVVTFHEASIVMAGKKKQPSAARLIDEFVRAWTLRCPLPRSKMPPATPIFASGAVST